MAHLLLCDDDVVLLRAVEIRFLRAGYRVTCCQDGQAAYEMIHRDLPSFVLSDVWMPRLGGLQLARKLRENVRSRELPIALITARGHELKFDELQREYGVLAMFSKPFSPQELLRFVNNTLGTSGN